MTVKVLLATTVRWPSAARLAGAFAAVGCTVEALLPAGHPAAKSCYLSRVHLYRPMAGPVSFLEAVGQSQTDFVVALDDRATALLLRAQKRATAAVAALICRSLGNTNHYAQLMSRNGFIAAARQANIRTPLTHAILSETDLEHALDEIGLPAVLKADGTWGGDGVMVVHDRNEAFNTWRKLSSAPSLLRSAVRAIRRSDAHFLQAALGAKAPAISVQQFIPGKPATTSFACWQGKILAANHLETLAAQEENGPASVLRRIEDNAMDEAAARLAARFELSGLHGLDYIRDAEGRAHLIEINPRSPQTSYLSFGAGHDLVSALVARIDGQARAPRPPIACDTVALFPQEWMRDPLSPYLTGTFHDVPWDDPAMIRAWMQSQQGRPALEKWRAFMANSPQGAQLTAQS